MRGITTLAAAAICLIWFGTGCSTNNSKPTPQAASPFSVAATVSDSKSIREGSLDSFVPLRPSVSGLPFSDYDSAMVDSIERHWNQTLKEQNFASDRRGKVVVAFRLHPDGSVSDVTTKQNTVGILLGAVSADAVADSAPFAPWPPKMAKWYGQDYREITFTFYYR